MRLEKTLLSAGVATPIFYYGNLILSSLFYPGYSHVTQYASELGSSAARYPMIFNTGVLLTGVAGIAAGPGFFLALRRLTGKSILAALTGLAVGLFGVAMIFGGLFPMPNPLHGGFGLGMAIHLGPLFLLLALWGREDLRGLKTYSLVAFLLGLTMFAIMMGVGSLVTRANVGVFQRLYSLSIFPWIGIAAYALRREGAGGAAALNPAAPPERESRW